MNRFVLFLSFAAFTAAASAQTTPAKPATPASKSLTSGTGLSIAATTKPATAATPAAVEPWIKLPPGVPRVVHLPVKMPFALRYEDIIVGKGAEGETGKLWHLKYTGWRAADGVKFDSWDMHSQPAIGPDGKPVMGPDGKPKMKDPEPIAIPQGVGRVIPGFDYGLDGMKIGGKRRIFIPWQMAYGTHAIPDRPERPGSPATPGIPAKSDLIFDVELVDVTDMPAPPHPMMPPNRPMPMQPHPGAGAPPPAGSAPGAQPNATPAPKLAPPATPPTSQSAPSAPTQPAATAQPATTQPSTPAQPQQK